MTELISGSRHLGSLGAVLILASVLAPASALAVPIIESDCYSSEASLSDDGSYVAFESCATNLVPGDTNGFHDVFVHEPATGKTVRVSLSTDRAQGDLGSSSPAISGTGRFVAFGSAAATLVPGDTNVCSLYPRDGTCPDVFVHDRDIDADGIFDELGEVKTVRVSVSSNGEEANGQSRRPAISADGRFVAFGSQASNLVAGDTNGFIDVFVRDRDLDGDGVFDEPDEVKTVRVSVSSEGAQSERGSAIHYDNPGHANNTNDYLSADGRHVVFHSGSVDLVPGDTNAITDAFVHDRDADGDGVFDEIDPEEGRVRTTRLSVAVDGTQANSSSFEPAIAAGGRFVTFYSYASNLIAGDTRTCRLETPPFVQVNCGDIYVMDRDGDDDGVLDEPGTVVPTRASVSSSGEQANEHSYSPSVSGDGRYVAWYSLANNLVSVNSKVFRDIYLRDLATGTTSLLSMSSLGVPAEDNSFQPAFSRDGTAVGFHSLARTLIVGDLNVQMDTFVRTLAGTTTRVSVPSA